MIEADDVVMAPVASRKIRANTITDADMLIGKTAKRSIAPHRSIRVNELESPKILEQGNTVTMRFVTPYMRINALGESLEDGGMGDIIRVRNHDSNKVIRARVLSSSEVDAAL